MTEQLTISTTTSIEGGWPERAEANRASTLKRVIDYLIVVPLALILAPLALIVFLVIKIVDSGPALFVQEREGRDGTTFRFYKFRTMYCDADQRLAQHLEQHPDRRVEWETIFKLDDDPRVLPGIGNFLRKTSLDELPNLWNILAGDMSLVGPRPFPLYHLDTFDPDFRSKRSSVWPGLTGPWQIERGGVESQQHWDHEYIDRWSLRRDLLLIVRTIPAVVLVRKPHF